jgi:hypothetical protein
VSISDKLVYSDDPCAVIRERIKAAGSVEKLMVVMFDRCSYYTARDWSVQFSHCFEITPEEFMKKFYKLRKVASQERAKAASRDSTAERKPDSEGIKRSVGIASSAETSSTKSSGKG